MSIVIEELTPRQLEDIEVHNAALIRLHTPDSTYPDETPKIAALPPPIRGKRVNLPDEPPRFEPDPLRAPIVLGVGTLMRNKKQRQSLVRDYKSKHVGTLSCRRGEIFEKMPDGTVNSYCPKGLSRMTTEPEPVSIQPSPVPLPVSPSVLPPLTQKYLYRDDAEKRRIIEGIDEGRAKGDSLNAGCTKFKIVTTQYHAWKAKLGIAPVAPITIPVRVEHKKSEVVSSLPSPVIVSVAHSQTRPLTTIELAIEIEVERRVKIRLREEFLKLSKLFTEHADEWKETEESTSTGAESLPKTT